MVRGRETDLDAAGLVRLATGLAMLAGLLAGVLLERHIGEAPAALARTLTTYQVQQCTKGPRL